jgi:hypothetical protein
VGVAGTVPYGITSNAKSVRLTARIHIKREFRRTIRRVNNVRRRLDARRGGAHASNGHHEPAHSDAIAAGEAKAFHHEQAFIRFRPYAARGHLDERNPLRERALPNV